MLSRLRTFSHDLVVAAIGGTIVAVLATGTAVAVSTTAVSITNPTTGKRAHVTNQQSLVTSDRDPYTGTYARVDATGRGLVSNVPGNPWNTLSPVPISSGDKSGTLLRITAPAKIALTSMTFTPKVGSGTIRGEVSATFLNDPNLACDAISAGVRVHDRFPILIQTTEQVHLTWPTPLIWAAYPAGHQTLCLNVTGLTGPAGWELDVVASGFRL